MIWQVKKYLQYRWRAQGNTSLRSPFVLDFHRHIIDADIEPVVEQIAQFAQKLKHDNRTITRTDFGAGHGGKGGGRYSSTVAETARRSSRRKREGALLYAMVKHYRPKRLLELGTHLGISTLYQAYALTPSAKFITLEGDPALAALASEHISKHGMTAVKVVEGPFTDSLPQLALESYRPDFVFLDGDHRYEPTLQYVRAIVPHMPQESVLILDDIYWSEGMTRAWEEVKAMPEVSLTIDVFFFGIAFIKREEPVQHVTLRL